MTTCDPNTDPACEPAEEEDDDWPMALSVALAVTGIAVVVLIVTICVVTWCMRKRRKPRTEKKLVRDVKMHTLVLPPPLGEPMEGERDRGRPRNVYVNPPGTAPYVDPTPNVKVIKQPHQDGQPSVFRNDVDRWGTHNVVHVDGLNNVSPPGARTSWHKQYRAVHKGPEYQDYYYRIYPEGNEDNLREYDYIPIRVEPGALNPPSGGGGAPLQNGGIGGEQGLTVINHTQSNTSINGYPNNQELIIDASDLSRHSGHGVEMRHKRQGVHFSDNDSENHSVIQNLDTRPDGTPEHRVSLNVVYEE